MTETPAETIARQRKWIDDLQSGMFVNCVYCGHRYGPGDVTPVSMADALKEHVRQCPEHPLSGTVATLLAISALAENAAWNMGKPGHDFTPAQVQSGFFEIQKAADEAIAKVRS